MTEVIYNSQDILEVTPQILDELKRIALASPRQRSRLCMHHSRAHLTQEMLIVFHHGTFMPPHRHPAGKSESYHVVEGSMTVYFFDDAGRVIRTIEMSAAGSGRAFLYRLSSNTWHMPVATSEWLAYHETYTGPFEKDSDVEFPSWAPREEDRDQVQRFLADIQRSGKSQG